MREMDVTFEIQEFIGVISEGSKGWCKEVNIVSWNGGQPKVDIRDWNETHTQMTRGITLTEEQMDRLCELWDNRN